MVSGRSPQAARGHVGIPDGLDFFQSVLFNKPVECRENLVQQADYLLRAKVGEKRGESDKVCDEDRGIGVVVGYVDLARLHSLGDGSRENIKEQALRVLLFLI